MAASAGKLAATLHRRTHRVTSALAYAALEWVLIALLMINSVLAYAIARFADNFDITPPCLLCSCVDHLFLQVEGGGGGDEAGAARWLPRDALSGDHDAEISVLGYGLHHFWLAVAGVDPCCSYPYATPWLLVRVLELNSFVPVEPTWSLDLEELEEPESGPVRLVESQ